MKFSKKKNYLINIGPYPFEVFYSPSKKAWNKLFREMDIKNVEYEEKHGGMCTLITKAGQNNICIITFNEMESSEDQVVGIIAHEATHAVDYLIECIGEDLPGKEFKAYTTQWITQNIYNVWKGLN